MGEAGLVDALEDTVRALERKQAMEREMLVYLLQGRESVQSRSAAKKLNAGTVCFGLVINFFFWPKFLKDCSQSSFFPQDHRCLALCVQAAILVSNVPSLPP